MANFTQLTASLAIIAALADLPNQTDGLTAAQLKAKYDEAAGLIKTFLNSTLIGELEASGAAAKLGAVVGAIPSNLQAFIDVVEAAGSGTLPPADSVTNVLMATDVKIGSLASVTTTEKSTVVGAINELDADVGDKSTLDTTATTSLVAAINELFASINTEVPAGKIDYFARATAPTGYLKANGQEISRTTYARLFTAIGDTFGVGDGSTTFNVPDMRGVFPRGLDDSKGYDVGRALGSYQADDNKTHTHTTSTNTTGAHTHTTQIKVESRGSGSAASIQGIDPYGSVGATPTSSSNGDHTHTVTIGSTGATEVKVKNIALLACIKY